MADEKQNTSIPSAGAGGGSDPGSEHPCTGCLWYYGAYTVNRACNYLLDTGKRRPCPPGKGCTVRREISCREDLRLRTSTKLY